MCAAMLVSAISVEAVCGSSSVNLDNAVNGYVTTFVAHWSKEKYI